MKIAVLSGKGGTGKTLVSVNLAATAETAAYYDCDVEEPNGHLFFKPELTQEEQIFVKSPEVDAQRCNGCRKCMDFCKFNAIACIQDKAVVFPDVCPPAAAVFWSVRKKLFRRANGPSAKLCRGILKMCR